MTESFDSGHADALEELALSPGWRVLTGRLEDELQRERDRMELGRSESETERARGAARTLRMLMGLPLFMAGEIRIQLKESKDAA